ncbi:serine/threonine-protein phosphatase pp2a-related [Anaeramoeba ignava]|uniref:Serine/threonine-protein phosphatase n=1 Tax=Anaeramoeba ignava TaxID=1746090 RepID=A0A9Q0LNH0_ANAIG|nr:serine/threonine-protein phosphatase pp2a-related [Anaeramoeba ignava]
MKLIFQLFLLLFFNFLSFVYSTNCGQYKTKSDCIYSKDSCKCGWYACSSEGNPDLGYQWCLEGDKTGTKKFVSITKCSNTTDGYIYTFYCKKYLSNLAIAIIVIVGILLISGIVYYFIKKKKDKRAFYEQWIEKLLECKFIPENIYKELCEKCKEILIEENNVHPIKSPVTICGNIHGQFNALLEIFRIGGELSSTNYVFLGDYVDIGYYSLETFSLLLALKIKYPEKIFLLRGNHESKHLSYSLGFYKECVKKYGSIHPWKYSCQVFNYLPIAAIIDGSIFCIHGGLSPRINTIDQIRGIDRMKEIPEKGSFCDLIWSDPDTDDGWHESPRGGGFLFGNDIILEFCRINDLDLICRSHSLIQNGYEYKFEDEKLVTIWSTPNFCNRAGNSASILQIDENLNRSFKIFIDDFEEKEKKKKKKKKLNLF